MNKLKHAEISGGGLAGLTAAAALAQRGWSVRVHERNPSLRIEGFGITILENGLRVLEAVGALEGAIEGGNRTRIRLNKDGTGRTVSSHLRSGRSYRITRQRLVTALAESARAAGADIVFGSTCVGADPDGALLLADGQRLPADLVVAADGVNSPIRDGLALTRSRSLVGQGATRVLIPRLPDDLTSEQAECAEEWWSGSRRVVFGSCSPTEIYMALSCSANDSTAKCIPLDIASWSQSFPGLAAYLARTAQVDWTHVQWAPFQLIKLHRWQKGRVAVIGDAAHAMPPNLGQGGGCALMTGLSLAHAMTLHDDVPTALVQWEQRERGLIERTQRWAMRYGRITQMPRLLQSAALWLLSANPYLHRSYQEVTRHIPSGAGAD